MKRLGVITVAALTLSTGVLTGCGDADRIKGLEAKSDALEKSNGLLRSRVQQLEANVSSLTQERDELKAATQRPAPVIDAAVPAPDPVPVKPAKVTKKKRHHHTH